MGNVFVMLSQFMCDIGGPVLCVGQPILFVSICKDSMKPRQS